MPRLCRWALLLVGVSSCTTWVEQRRATAWDALYGDTPPLAEWIRADAPVVKRPRPRGAVEPEIWLAFRVHEKAEKLRRCYLTELRFAPRLSGDLVVRLERDASGGLLDARIDFSTMQSAGLEPCVLEVIRTLELPPDPGGSVARHPIVFTSSQTAPELLKVLKDRYKLRDEASSAASERRQQREEEPPW